MRLFKRLCELCKQGDWLIDQYCSEKLLCCVRVLGGNDTNYLQQVYTCVAGTAGYGNGYGFGMLDTKKWCQIGVKSQKEMP